MAEDIYPLGLGGGLLTDAMNFALNNIYQYGQRTKQSNQRMGEAMTNVASGKSADLGPLTSDIVSTSPLYTGLINWTGMTEPAKAMIQRFGRAYPNMLSAMEKAPQIMEAGITPDLPGNVAGRLRKPIPSAHFMDIRPDYAANLSTIGHEMQHSLNAPRVAATNPVDALTIGTLLKSVLPGEVPSLNTVLQSQVSRPNFLQRLFGAPDQYSMVKPNAGLMRNAMDEGLAYLGQKAAEGKGGDLVKTLADRLGVNWDNPNVVKGMGAASPDLMALIRHGTDPESAVGIIKEGLRPGSSISKIGGRDFEGYPVTFEIDDALKGAKDYSSPFGATMHEGAAKTGQTATNIKRVFFDPNEFSYKEDALDVFRKLREALNQTGRKDIKIEGATWHDPSQSWRYGGTPSMKELPSFRQHVQKASDNRLQRLFDEHLDNIEAVPEGRARVLRDRLDQILVEMEKRGFGVK